MSKWQDWLKQVKGRQRLLILFLVGILLLVIAFPTTPGKWSKKWTEENEEGENNQSEKQLFAMEYERDLEYKMAKALAKVSGVGRVEVMITLKSDGQKIVEKDQFNNNQTSEEADSAGGTRNTQDKNSDRTSVYEQKGDGSQVPYVSKQMKPEIEGVLVVADGGENARVIQNITEAIQALFDVQAHKIKIMKMADTY